MSQPRLELHFDINKTVLVQDRVQGIDMETACHQILHWSSWGTGDGDNWHWNGEEPGIARTDKNAVLFGDFVFSRPKLRKNRVALKNRFASEGFPGHALRERYEQMVECLTRSSDVQRYLGESQWAKNAGLDGKFVQLLPSFFNLLVELGRRNHAFSLVFRSFGSDIPAVATELTAFCNGEHPAYPDVRFDGSAGRLDLRLPLEDSSRFGSLYRGGASGADLSDIRVALGVLDTPPGADRKPYAKPHRFYEERASRLLSSLGEFHEHIGSGGAYAFRDDYSGWARSGFKKVGGKPIQIDPKCEGDGVHRIFFDDNIRSQAANIIDIRDSRTGKPMSFKHANNRHLVRVDSYRAIVEPNYFIEAVDLCRGDG